MRSRTYEPQSHSGMGHQPTNCTRRKPLRLRLGSNFAGAQMRDHPYDYERALAQPAPDHRGSLIVMVSPFFFRDRARLAEFALRHRIVSMFGFREWVEAGGLLFYGPNIASCT